MTNPWSKTKPKAKKPQSPWSKIKPKTKPVNPILAKIKAKKKQLADQTWQPDPEAVPDSKLGRLKHDKIIAARDAQDYHVNGVWFEHLREHYGGVFGTYWTIQLRNGDDKRLATNIYGSWMIPLDADGKRMQEMAFWAARERNERMMKELDRLKRKPHYKMHDQVAKMTSKPKKEKS